MPALVAIRQVQTPAGAFAQEFVVNRSSLTKWRATPADEMVAELRPGDSRGAEVAPGWRLTVEPNPRMLAQAAGDGRAVARTFLIRFIGLGSIAVLAAAFVVLLVMRAEKLAHERSLFSDRKIEVVKFGNGIVRIRRTVLDGTWRVVRSKRERVMDERKNRDFSKGPVWDRPANH